LRAIVCRSSMSIDVKLSSWMSFHILTDPSEEPVAKTSDPGKVAILVMGLVCPETVFTQV